MSRVLKGGVDKTHSPHRDCMTGWRWMNRSLHYHSLSLNVSPSLTRMEGLRVHAVGCGLAWYIREYSHILIVTAFLTLPQTHHFFKTASCRLIRVGVYTTPIGGVSKPHFYNHFSLLGTKPSICPPITSLRIHQTIFLSHFPHQSIPMKWNYSSIISNC